MTFADQLKFYRRELGLTQVQLAELLEVPARTLWNWEKDKLTPYAITQEGAIARLDQIRMKAELEAQPSWTNGIEPKVGDVLTDLDGKEYVFTQVSKKGGNYIVTGTQKKESK